MELARTDTPTSLSHLIRLLPFIWQRHAVVNASSVKRSVPGAYLLIPGSLGLLLAASQGRYWHVAAVVSLILALLAGISATCTA